ncbi:hypothetical protein HMPREF1860_01871 [Prevotella amnii]|uniref:Uncharacterized protein n=1 Tax=Prevotella amnii TaxID=419005 RepID=A0A134B5A1_9BACT|nr:hypothetical protein HMPREF1860_01871 [Prevotella amnii]
MQLHSFSCLYSAIYVIIKALRLIVGVMKKVQNSTKTDIKVQF